MVVLKCPGWPVKGVLIRTLPVGGKVHRADVASSNQTVAGSGNVAVRVTRVLLFAVVLQRRLPGIAKS